MAVCDLSRIAFGVCDLSRMAFGVCDLSRMAFGVCGPPPKLAYKLRGNMGFVKNIYKCNSPLSSPSCLFSLPLSSLLLAARIKLVTAHQKVQRVQKAMQIVLNLVRGVKVKIKTNWNALLAKERIRIVATKFETRK